MKKLQLSLCAAGAYVLLVAVLALFGSRPATGQENGPPPGRDVRVVNPSSEPVPVAGQVTVSSLPAVQLDTTTPLPVADADNPARQPFQAQFGLGEPQVLTVPAGKRLVIEHVTGVAYSTGNVFWTAVLTTAGGEFASHLFPVTKAGVSPGGQNVFVMAAETRLYADSGSNVSIQGDALGPAAERATSISGYLVDAP